MRSKLPIPIAFGVVAMVLLVGSEAMTDSVRYVPADYTISFGAGALIGVTILLVYSVFNTAIKSIQHEEDQNDEFVPLLDRLRKKK